MGSSMTGEALMRPYDLYGFPISARRRDDNPELMKRLTVSLVTTFLALLGQL